MRKHAMIDLEGLGHIPNSIITQIGCVIFDHQQIIEQFHTNVIIKSCEKFGLEATPETLEWWKQQNNSWYAPGIKKLSLPFALTNLLNFLAKHNIETLYVWSKGTDYDLAILNNAIWKIQKEKKQFPKTKWKFANQRDFRTIIKSNPNIPKYTPPHNALEDAKTQAQILIKWFPILLKIWSKTK